MRDVIRIKPHHFIDFLTAIGEGRVEFKPHPCGHADYLFAHKLARDPQRPLQIVLDVDDVCVPCKFNQDGTCKGNVDTAFLPDAPASRQPLTCIIDRRWCNRLNVHDRDTMSALDLCRLVQTEADDISDIYIEIPSDIARERAKKLSAGVDAFLQYAASLSS